MSAIRTAYRLLYPLALAGARAASLVLPKVREAFAGRRGQGARWEEFARGLSAPPVWFHVASVGEFEQARPVISALERTRPDIPVMLTFSSPSGFHFARRREKVGTGSIRFIDYLPFDRAAAMSRCLALARPRLLVFVKFDLWPNLVWEASSRRVPMVLIDATLSPSSRRYSAAGRILYGDLYRRIDRILAISEEDAARFTRSAPGHAGVSVTGDTRFDRVMERWQNRPRRALELPQDGLRTLIAGSTWPPDEARLLPAVARLLAEDATLRFVVVPHEPLPAHVGALRRWAAEAGLAARTVSEGPARPGTRVIIVDVVGVLAEAYAGAEVAYVGGAFSTGVHSVIEPAIAGLPVVFGPRHGNSFEALQLVARGGAAAVHDEASTHAQLRRYLGDPGERARAGDAARAYVESQLGATEKCMAAISPYL